LEEHWKGSSDRYDFVITTDTGVILDVFASEVQDNDDAHVESCSSNSVHEANLQPKHMAAEAPPRNAEIATDIGY